MCAHCVADGPLGREAAARQLIDQAQAAARDYASAGIMSGVSLPQALASQMTYTGVRFSRVDALQTRISQLGLPIRLAHNVADVGVLRQGCQHLLDVLENHASAYGRYYFEMHPHATRNWVVGFTLDGTDLCAFPGESSESSSFGIGDDGSAWWAGQSQKYCSPMHDVQVVGVLIDLHASSGSICI